MADEAVNVVLLGNKGDPVEVIVADGASIPKNTLMQLSSSPQTVTATSGAGQIFFGIFSEEKVANDGKTKIGVYLRGIFKCTAGASITVGELLMNNASSGGANEVIPATPVAEQALAFAVALESVSDQNTLKVLLNVGIGGVLDT